VRLRDRVTTISSAVAVAAAVLLVGGATRWAQAVVAGVVAIAVIPQLRSRRGFARVSPLIAALVGAIGLTTLQLVPLPHALLEFLQPIGIGLRDDGSQLMGTSPWEAVSLDAPSSLRALGMLVTLLGVAWLGLRLAVSERGRYRILATVAGVSGLTAVIVWVHVGLGAERLYGLYTPEAHPHLLGPLLNDNHLGGLMAIGAVVAAGLAMHTRQATILRVLWTLDVTVCGATAVAGTSRGATLALVSGLVLVAGLLVAQRFFGGSDGTQRSSRLTTSLPIVVVAACAIFVIVYASAGEVSNQLARTTIQEVQAPNSKFAIWRSSTVLIEESPILGVGRGAFESAITRVHPAAAVSSFSHAENEYVQAVVDWGIGGGAVLGVLGVWLMANALRRWRDGPLAAGALGAVGAVALQSSVDFGVEILGLAVPVTVLLATLSYVPLKELEGHRVKRAVAGRVVYVAALVAAMFLLLTNSTRELGEDHAMLAKPDSSLDDVRSSVERHPLDYYGYARAAQLLIKSDQAGGVQALNHALRLDPHHPGLHHLAARMLVRAHRSEQAAIEYAAVLRISAAPAPIIAELLSALPMEDAASAIPADLPSLPAMIQLLDDAHAGTVAIRWLSRVLDLRPNNSQACDALFRFATQHEDLLAATTASARCGEAASRERRIALGQMLLAHNKFAEARRAVDGVETWDGTVDEKIAGWLVICDALAGDKLWDDTKRCLRRLDVALIPPERRTEISTRLDKIGEVVRGNGQP